EKESDLIYFDGKCLDEQFNSTASFKGVSFSDVNQTPDSLGFSRFPKQLEEQGVNIGKRTIRCCLIETGGHFGPGLSKPLFTADYQATACIGPKASKFQLELCNFHDKSTFSTKKKGVPIH
ncbi:45390_t:CDS:2, partial [Gigaspora margarita]